MRLSDSNDIWKMGKRAQSVVHAAELHYRAVFVEALLTPQGKRPVDPDGPDVAGAFLRWVGKIDQKQRDALVESLMTSDLSTRRLTSQDREYLTQIVRPGSQEVMADRSDLFRKWGDVLFSDSKPDPKNENEVVQWTQNVIRDFFPSVGSLDEDGRDPDSEPDDPQDDDTDVVTSHMSPVPPPDPYSELKFVVDTVECLQDTAELGRDEINYSGVATEGPLADFIQPSVVGSTRMAIRNAGQFRNGDTIEETGRGPMHIYDLLGHNFPRLFVVHLTMAEIDEGGFSEFMEDFNNSLTADLETNWRFFLGLYGFNIAFYGGLGALGGLVGAALGASIAAVMGAITTAIMSRNNDEIFEFRSVVLTLENNALNLPPFNGNPISETLEVVLELARYTGGRYKIHYHWELVGGTVSQAPIDQDPT